MLGVYRNDGVANMAGLKAFCFVMLWYFDVFCLHKDDIIFHYPLLGGSKKANVSLVFTPTWGR